IGALQLAPFRSSLLKRRLRCRRQGLEERGPSVGAESSPRQQRHKPKGRSRRRDGAPIPSGYENNRKQNPKMGLECKQPDQATGDQRPPRQKEERSAQQRGAQESVLTNDR